MDLTGTFFLGFATNSLINCFVFIYKLKFDKSLTQDEAKNMYKAFDLENRKAVVFSLMAVFLLVVL